MSRALHHHVRSMAAHGLRPLPTRMLVQAALRGPAASRRVARIGLVGRTGHIAGGVGAGLEFNCGQSNPDYLLGVNELPIQRAFARWIAPGQTVVDVGANVGFFTMLAAHLTGPTGLVVAVEPDADNRSRLGANARANHFDHVRVVDAAAGSAPGDGELWIDTYSGGHGLATTRPPHSRRSITVRVVTIDELVSSGVAPRPALVKIDVEGTELDVLEGAVQTLARQRPVLVVEIDDGDKSAFARKRREVTRFLEERRYRVDWLDDAYPPGGWNVAHAVAHPVGS